ncbi:hypothetical protein [Methylomonas fluvii]|jgi:hypothetical protein|uniref:Conjugative transfer protein TrbI n=1 Tax=Methylomonas fluvii TaxID=1854564 RepID=A0ABR9D7A6_9GAMM|nr:hypothetical protein [Methylomonas fluvii]MBD9358965.1 hypothetical protein [Methylomonas fluvii]CAD6871631.1 hypothetical protein [Methylomonas fluvii]
MDPKSQWLSTVFIAACLGGIGGWLAAQQQLQQPIARLNMVTPVFVLDRAKLIQSIPPNANQEQMAKIVDDWQGQAKKLSDAGYLVIDSTAVVAAPEDVYVRQAGR